MTYVVSGKRHRQLDEVDQMAADLRSCVHEFGLPIVSILVKHGIRKPAHVREVVHEIWSGARQSGQRGGGSNTLEWFLLQTGGAPSAAALQRVLTANGLMIVHTAPTKAMINASMATVTPADGPMTKQEKHKRRLFAALQAAASEGL